MLDRELERLKRGKRCEAGKPSIILTVSDGIPQVRTGKRRDEHLYVKHMLLLPADTPFGNLSLKCALIIERLDHLNGLIDGVFASYQAAVGKELGSETHHLLLAEGATYWLRKTADELLVD